MGVAPVSAEVVDEHPVVSSVFTIGGESWALSVGAGDERPERGGGSFLGSGHDSRIL